LIFSCVKFHPFADGNKRTSIFLGMHFLDLDKILPKNMNS
ncbi:Fic family protein, partial [Campylobacter jejuni]